MGSNPVPLENVYKAQRLAESEFHDALVREFPVGSTLSYRHGQHNRVAEVLSHSRDRIRLTGTMGVDYWKYWDRTFTRLYTADHDGQTETKT